MARTKDVKQYNYAIFDYICKLNKVTPNKVHEATGVATATLSEWKKGTYEPKQDKIEKIADYFHISADYFKEFDLDKVKDSLNQTVMIANNPDIIIESLDKNMGFIKRITAYQEKIQKMSGNIILDKVSQDPEFVEHISYLFALPDDARQVIFDTIKSSYERYLKKKEKASNE